MLTTKNFVEKAVVKHNNIYDYSLTDYVHNTIKVNIICKKHGDFLQSPSKHLYGDGCPKCSGKNKTTEEFTNELKQIHGNKYDYSLVEYTGIKSKIKIVCSIHGIFEQLAHNHLFGKGCAKCSNIEMAIKRTSSNAEFIEKANLLYKNEYDYSLVEYKNAKTKVKIICKKHGIFEQVPDSHLNGNKCPKCNSSKGEEKVRKFLQENKIMFEEQKRFSDCRDKYPLIFDFYVPLKNILIEYDGLQHYRPWRKLHKFEEQFTKIKIRDKIKTEYAKNKAIKLIRIPYTEFNRIEEILAGLL